MGDRMAEVQEVRSPTHQAHVKQQNHEKVDIGKELMVDWN